MTNNPVEYDSIETMETVKDRSKAFYSFLLVGSIVGLFSSAKLVLEKISFWQQKAEGDSPLLGCDINPIVGCGPIINTDQASIFWNIPNPLIGVIAFSIVITISVLLLAGVKLPEWIWAGMQAGVVFGLAIVTYLQYSSIYVLSGLCPYCMAVWIVMIPIFWLVTKRNLMQWLPQNPASKFVYLWTPLLLALHFITLIALIWFQFGTALWA